MSHCILPRLPGRNAHDQHVGKVSPLIEHTHLLVGRVISYTDVSHTLPPTPIHKVIRIGSWVSGEIPELYGLETIGSADIGSLNDSRNQLSLGIVVQHPSILVLLIDMESEDLGKVIQLLSGFDFNESEMIQG
ncbi:hypothetical protein L1987_57677 [Smallanthus sonchifolius]|uniref:Uncharacterized protein n=1 Tax=Smallanthus sonchifolius TaxID=185202 RepID=A0ACB9DD79_9ASTR|nr:hypothetical protein L1987_57677 [Smallanthus sonchifolius]